ncbi:MAG: hypothetical protein A2Y62_20320 [Candidatus Fischerbacteria bacterium RBG_13_37_8]|uniref:Lycopene cyclase domain-containing protein n=1 Tax=Candidatus Fischerbacteria bacterium RBG_13_37_8 TaxID=1817863 RepID=A0A1F5VWC9_9BACT|nr:MAG: hypothetical protein A2Y62_20320 [Candidatus Fischerbacteria bacterium RBG_13_37_8]
MRITGWIGLIVIIVAEILLFQGNQFIGLHFTPIQWWAYILLMDALIEKFWKKSYIFQYPGEFILMILYSFGCWLIFEIYNWYYIPNWYYTALSENLVYRWIGYFIAFTTIFPGIFLTTRFLNYIGLFKNWHMKEWHLNKRKLLLWSVVGLLFLIFPFFYSSPYIFAIVWLGFILLLDPINYYLGYDSILGDFAKGRLARFLNLMLAGYICGILWEFWNYWAIRKWIYTVPFTQDIKIFEMPIAGFSGFGPFAIECFCMYEFLKGISKKIFKKMPMDEQSL